jgi:hypothetical protein
VRHNEGEGEAVEGEMIGRWKDGRNGREREG